MICESCRLEMKHRDHVMRVVKYAGGYKVWVRLERVQCPKCGKIQRRLPSYILRFKHYSKDIIDDVIAHRITSDTIGYEDYPCEITMQRWIFSHKEHVL